MARPLFKSIDHDAETIIEKKPKKTSHCCQFSCLCLLLLWCLVHGILFLLYLMHSRTFVMKTMAISPGYQEMLPILPTFMESLTLTLSPNVDMTVSAILFNKKPILSQYCQWSDLLELKGKQMVRQYHLSRESRIRFDWEFEQAEVILFNSTKAYEQWKLNGGFDSVDTWYYQNKMKHSLYRWISHPMTVYALVVAKDTFVGSKGGLIISAESPCVSQPSPQLSSCSLTQTQACTLTLPNRLDMVYLMLNASMRTRVNQTDAASFTLEFKQRGFWSSPISVVFVAISLLVLLFTFFCCIKMLFACCCSKPEEDSFISYRQFNKGVPPLPSSRSLTNVRRKE
jgi:hypothetical protein